MGNRMTREEFLEKIFSQKYDELKGKDLRLVRVKVPGKEVSLAQLIGASETRIYQNMGLHIGTHMGEDHTGESIGLLHITPTEATVVAAAMALKSGNIELGFPVYSRGFMPRGPIKKDEGNINTPIMCGGVRVEPGDLVVGDSDGVCVIPKAHIDVVLAEAETKLAYEEKRTATIAAYRKAKAEGTELPQLAPQWVLDMLSAQ